MFGLILTLQVGAGESVVALEALITGINVGNVIVGEPTAKGLGANQTMVAYRVSPTELRIIVVPTSGTPNLPNNLQLQLPLTIIGAANIPVTYKLIDATPAVVAGPTVVVLTISTIQPPPGAADSDIDDISDANELKYGLDPNNKKDAALDFDGDGLSNLAEINTHGTNPLVRDSNSDGLSDGFAVSLAAATNPSVCPEKGIGPSQDFDCDGLTNLQEQVAGTKPDVADSDGDSLSDKVEAQNGLNPRDATDAAADVDFDGYLSRSMTSAQELNSTPVTKPLDPDTDGDLMPDGWELYYGLPPTSAQNAVLAADPKTGPTDDKEPDGLKNYQEFLLGTNPNVADSDGDCMQDNEEVGYGLNPASAADGETDMDGDGMSNKLECTYNKAGINIPDSDNDGMKDGFEYTYGFPYKNAATDAVNNGAICSGGLSTLNNGTGPANDRDCDGLTNLQEHDLRINPLVLDTDKDGMNDKAELDAKRNPAVNEPALMSIIQNLLLD